MDNTKKKYSNELVTQAEENYKNKNLDKAKNKINKAQAYWPSNEEISKIKPQITYAINKKEAEIDDAINLAASKIQQTIK